MPFVHTYMHMPTYFLLSLLRSALFTVVSVSGYNAAFRGTVIHLIHWEAERNADRKIKKADERGLWNSQKTKALYLLQLDRLDTLDFMQKQMSATKCANLPKGIGNPPWAGPQSSHSTSQHIHGILEWDLCDNFIKGFSASSQKISGASGASEAVIPKIAPAGGVQTFFPVADWVNVRPRQTCPPAEFRPDRSYG